MRSAVLRALSQSSLACSRSRSPTNSFLLLARTYAVPTAFADEEAETVVFPRYLSDVCTLDLSQKAKKAFIYREGSGVSYGLNWALAGRGVIVKDKAYFNLKKPELEKYGARKTESLSGIALYMRGNAIGGASDISKAQFSKLLKQVASHISSVSSVFVQDGGIGSSPKCDAKVRVISDSPSAISQLADVLWKTPARAISHDSCPLTVYIASSVSPKIREILGLGSQSNAAFAVADVEHSSLVLCGNAFADVGIMKDALSALAAPIILARGALPLTGRILVSGNSIVLLFAPEEIIKNSSDLHRTLVSLDAGVVLSSNGVAPFFQTKDPAAPNMLKMPSAVVFGSADSSGALPPISKLSPGQAAYHFLAGYHDGKFMPAYTKSPSPVDPLALANALHTQLKDNEIPAFLINVNHAGKHIPGLELRKLVESSLSSNLPDIQPEARDAKVAELKGKYKTFLSGKFEVPPEEFSF